MYIFPKPVAYFKERGNVIRTGRKEDEKSSQFHCNS